MFIVMNERKEIVNCQERFSFVEDLLKNLKERLENENGHECISYFVSHTCCKWEKHIRGLLVCRAKKALRPKRCYCGSVPIYVTGYLAGYISVSRRRVLTSFPQWPSHLLWCLLFKKANHFLTTLNIRSDPMATWECAKQVQASSELLGKRNSCTLHFREFKKARIDLGSRRRTYICSLLKVWHKLM